MAKMLRALLLPTAAAVLLWAAPFSAAKVLDETAIVDETPVHYKVILPKDYDPEKAYPGVLAFPPGSQTADMVMTIVERSLRGEAEKRGYIVIVPAAPRGRLFIEAGALVFPEFITQMFAKYKIRDNKFHAAGMSNGGLSAFHIAASYPQYFWSVTGFPGYLRDATPQRVNALEKMCINMHVGELDTPVWRESMQAQAAQFRKLGYKVRFTIEKDQPHVMNTLQGFGAARLFDQFEEARMGCSR
jgi:predicted peptidase